MIPYDTTRDAGKALFQGGQGGQRCPFKYISLHAFRLEQGCKLGCLGVAPHLHSTSIYLSIYFLKSLIRKEARCVCIISECF